MTLYKLGLLMNQGTIVEDLETFVKDMESQEQMEQWTEQEYCHPEIYWIEEGEARKRLCIAKSIGHVRLIDAMLPLIEAPFAGLYILHTSPSGNETMRYESPWSSLEDMQAFLFKFEDFLEQDGRHDLWLLSDDRETQVVWDRHNLMFIYGNFEPLIPLLHEHGLKPGDSYGIFYAHAHHYHQEFNDAEDQVLNYCEWTKSPLKPADEEGLAY